MTMWRARIAVSDGSRVIGWLREVDVDTDVVPSIGEGVWFMHNHEYQEYVDLGPGRMPRVSNVEHVIGGDGITTIVTLEAHPRVGLTGLEQAPGWLASTSNEDA